MVTANRRMMDLSPVKLRQYFNWRLTVPALFAINLNVRVPPLPIALLDEEKSDPLSVSNDSLLLSIAQSNPVLGFDSRAISTSSPTCTVIVFPLSESLSKVVPAQLARSNVNTT